MCSTKEKHMQLQLNPAIADFPRDKILGLRDFNQVALIREAKKPAGTVLLLAIADEERAGMDAIMGLAVACEEEYNLHIDQSRLRFAVAKDAEEISKRGYFEGVRVGFILHQADLRGLEYYPELARILPVH
jgi:hypothetical protein